MKLIYIIMCLMCCSCSTKENKSVGSKLDDHYKVLRDALMAFSKGEAKFIHNEYAVDASKPYEGFTWITVKINVKNQSKVTLSFRSHTPMNVLTTSKIDDFMDKLDSEYSELRKCIEEIAASEKTANNPNIQQSSNCDTQKNSVTVNGVLNTAEIIRYKNSKYLDFVINE